MTPEEKIAYDARHYRMKRALGPARLQKCVRCAEDGIDKPAREWAQIHSESGEDPWADYLPLCWNCHHIVYDKTGHWTPHTDESKRKMSESHKRAFANGRPSPVGLSNVTHCPQGHPYDEENTYPIPSGGRGCRECRREATRKSRARRRQARQAS